MHVLKRGSQGGGGGGKRASPQLSPKVANSVHSLPLVAYFGVCSNQTFRVKASLSLLSLLLISLFFVVQFPRKSQLSHCGTKSVGGVNPYIAVYKHRL